MDAKEFLFMVRNECKKHERCNQCPLSGKLCNDFGYYCDMNDRDIFEAVDEVKRLAREKTYADDFFEHFPNAMKRDDGTPGVCREQVYGTETSNCANTPCRHCWNEPFPEEETR